LPVTACFTFQPPAPPAPPAPWTAPPLSGNPALTLSLSGTSSTLNLAGLLQALNVPDCTGGMLPELAERWNLGHLMAYLSENKVVNAPLSCAVYGLSTASGVPLPQLALASSTQEDFAALLPPLQSPNRLFPYLWNGCAGWMFPLFGDQFSLYGFQRDGTQYLASREPLAAMLASVSHTVPVDTSDDVLLNMDWKRTAPLARETVVWAAAHELLSETNAEDLDAAFIPVMNALSRCGTLNLTGKWSSEGLLCQGKLAASVSPETRQ